MTNLVAFNGSNNYLKHTSQLSGFTNGKQLTIACWLNPISDFRRVFTANDGAQSRIDINVFFGRIDVILRSSSGSVLLQQKAVATDIITRGLFHFCLTVDLSITTAEIYIDGVDDSETPTIGPVNGNIDLTHTNWKIGANWQNTEKWHGEMYGLWIDKIHLTASQVSSFLSESGKFIDIGSDGSAITGSAPNMYFADLPGSFGDNKGDTGSANDFTIVGNLSLGEAFPDIIQPDLMTNQPFLTFRIVNINTSTTITETLLSFTDTFLDVTINASETISVDLLSFTDTFFDLNIRANDDIFVDLLSFTDTFLIPLLTGDEVVPVDLIDFTTFFLTLDILVNDKEIIPVDLLTFTDSFLDATIIEDMRVQIDLLQFTDTFYITVIAGPEPILINLLTIPPTFNSVNIFEGQPLSRRLQESDAAGSAYIVLFELDATAIGSTIFYFTENAYTSTPVFWQGNEYTPIEIEAEGFEWSGTGALPTPKIRISNATKLMSSLVIGFGDLVGATLTRWRTLEEFLDDGAAPDPNAHMPQDIFTIDRKTKHNKYMIEWQLSSKMDFEGTKLPKRQALRDTCTFIYRTFNSTTGELEYNGGVNQCPYIGNDGDPPATAGPFFDLNGDPSTLSTDRCGKRLSSCKKRFVDPVNNVDVPIPGRFFPSIGRNRV